MKTAYKIEKLVFEDDEFPHVLIEQNIAPSSLFIEDNRDLPIELNTTSKEFGLQRIRVGALEDKKVLNIFGNLEENELVDFFNTQIRRAEYYKTLAEKGQPPFVDYILHLSESIASLMGSTNDVSPNVNTFFKRADVAKEMEDDAIRRYEKDQERKLAKIEELTKSLIETYRSL